MLFLSPVLLPVEMIVKGEWSLPRQADQKVFPDWKRRIISFVRE
jgi:hypothetical protein